MLNHCVRQQVSVCFDTYQCTREKVSQCFDSYGRNGFMELIERIEQQMAATQLPLFAITLAAVPCPDTPVILTLHWHAFVHERLADVEGAETIAYKAVPSSALQLNQRWEDV